jgi:DNA polymerase-3 subunit beta
MKFTIPAGSLARALGLAALPLDDPRVRKIAALGTIRLNAHEGRVVLRSNILDLAVDVLITVGEIEEVGEAAVPGERLAALVAAMAPDRTVTVTSTDNYATVTAGRSRYRLPILPLDQLPAPLSLGETFGEIEIDRDDALRLLARPLFAASTEETRYYLNGLFLQTTGGELTVVGTDGHRLVRIIMPVAGTLSSDRRLIIPLGSVKLIIKILRSAKPDSAVRLRRAPTLFEVSVGDVGFVSKLIDGEFPQYERIFPKPSENNVVINRAELAQAIARLAAVAVTGDQKMRVAQLSWAADGLHLALGDDVAHDVIEAETSGTGGVAVQIAHLAELLDELKGERISLNVNGPNDPILIGDPDDAGITALQMPCRY